MVGCGFLWSFEAADKPISVDEDDADDDEDFQMPSMNTPCKSIVKVAYEIMASINS